jgi:hypothetical protein
LVKTVAAIDYAALSIADTVTSGKGKSANISYGGDPVYWTPGGLQVAFEPGSFNGEPATRVNMQFRASAVEAALDKLDGWIVDYVAANAARILGKDMAKAEVQNRYQSCLKRSEKYEPTFKVKVNLEGQNQVGYGTPASRQSLSYSLEGAHGDPSAEAQGPLAHGSGLRSPLGGHGPNV